MEDVVAGAPSSSTSPAYQQIDQHSLRKPSGKASKVSTSVKGMRDEPGGGIKLAPNARSTSVKRKSPKLRVSPEKRRERQNASRNPNSLEELPHKPVAQDGSSGGREGRQFTVGNVGNNGMIYLRPVMRPPYQRTQQLPPFVFPPVTPPRSASIDGYDRQNVDALRSSPATGNCSPWDPNGRPRRSSQNAIQNGSPPFPRAKHQRAHSFSTAQEQPAMQTSGIGTYRIVIDRPEQRRPKTADQIPIPTLEVQIPHYRLGSPRFSPRGTAFLHSSSFTRASTNGDLRSSYLSQTDISKLFPTAPVMMQQSLLSRPHSPISNGVSPNQPPPNFSRSPTPIGPSIYDALTFPPQSDHPSVVKYSLTTGEIIAATPPRIIAQITSPNFLDYELLSDFFLTYRLFLPPSELVEYMVARLQWAVNREDEVGKVVRVRTFVAIRHWILNYFADDFFPDYELRVKFCDMVNLLYGEIKRRPGGGGSDARIIGEAKKCWQRTCALYWDGPGSVSNNGADEQIYPGGPVGNREEPQIAFANQLDYTGHDSRPQQIMSVMEQGNLRGTAGTPVQDVVGGRQENAGPAKRSTKAGISHSDSGKRTRRQASESSVQAQSCSIPARTRKQPEYDRTRPLAAHPVNVSPEMSSHLHSPPPTVRRGPGHSHKRSGSFSDALRDDRAPLPLPKAIFQSTQLLMTVPYAGSLVRGNLFPPTQAVVEIVPPCTPVRGEQLGLPQASSASSRVNTGSQRGATTGSNPGVKKFFGSVRRALSARQNHLHGHSTGGTSLSIFPSPKLHGPEMGRSQPPNRVGNVGEHTTGPQSSTARIDLLGAGVVEAFKKAVQREASNEEAVGGAAGSDNGSAYELEQRPEAETPTRNAIPSTVTMGSKSIVIVDDTWTSATQNQMTSGPLLPETPTDICVPHRTDEAPMPTGPSQSLRREDLPSIPLRSHRKGFAPVQRRSRSFSFERTPISSRQVDSPVRGPSPGTSAFGRSSARFGGRSFKSSKSGSLRRYASYQSGISRRSPSRSFDATTVSGSITGSHNHPLDPLPARMLRRRPGGDLRAVHHVADLEPLPRPKSAGSLSEYSGSVSSSILQTSQTVQVGMATGDYSPQAPQRFSLGALAEGGNKDTTSLVETHSSQPNMRPSFEAEVAKLAQIPDDDDDHGVESALMKLEGRYEKRQSENSFSRTVRTLSLGATTYSGDHDVANETEEKRRHRHKKVLDNTISETPPLPDGEQTSLAASPTYEPGEGIPAAARPKSQSLASDDSYSSTPLLERGLTGDSLQEGSALREWSDISMPAPLFSNNRTVFMPYTEPASSHPSMEYVEKTESMVKMHQDSTVPVNSPSHESFLFDDSDEASDLSSELSIEVISREETQKQNPLASPPPGSRAVISEMSLPYHPLRHPPSPPLTMAQAFPVTLASDPGEHNRLPPTPDPTPTLPSQGISHSQKSSDKSTFLQNRASGTTAESIHLPFILAFDSDLLARQFTLIEKDALNEVDWRELVELKWKQTPPVVRDWVEFLKTQEPKGVEMVIARFNLMVKWTMSEIVMTRNVAERALAIVKYIHIAAHARRYQNFATMYQITIALLGIDIARLTKTWELVPRSDLQTFRDMEALVQPVRNFHGLRVEMETAVGEGGCIPFVGIYTHDLIYNAQRPSQIASTPTTEPLVNFERHRTTAAIVKSLLRLLEASSKYTFEAVDGACERCLWIAALSDDEIRTLSRELE